MITLLREHDLAPAQVALSTETIPKSVARVLNAERVHQEWHNKRRGDEDTGGDAFAEMYLIGVEEDDSSDEDGRQ